jgi:hypothetical protein
MINAYYRDEVVGVLRFLLRHAQKIQIQFKSFSFI